MTTKVERVPCAQCDGAMVPKTMLLEHIMINHKKVWDEVKGRFLDWLFENPERLGWWNIIAPKGSEEAVAEAVFAIELETPNLNGLEFSEAVAARVPGARVGPVAGHYA